METSGSFWGWLGVGLAAVAIGVGLILTQAATALGWTFIAVGVVAIIAALWVGGRSRILRIASVPAAQTSGLGQLHDQLAQVRDAVVAVQEAAGSRGTPQALAPLARLRAFATGNNASKFPKCAAMAGTDAFAADLPAKALAELEAAISEIESKLASLP